MPYKTRPVDFPTETRSAEYRQCNIAGMCAFNKQDRETGKLSQYVSREAGPVAG